MPDSQTPPNDPLRFSEQEIDLLGRTADALSAWMGKPVLAEVVSAAETGFEWVVFAVPLLPDQDPTTLTTVQVGGTNGRVIGSKGGLPVAKNQVYACEYLWAIQLSALQGVRFIKVDGNGEEIAWTDDLREVLPFDLRDPESQDTDDPA